MQNKEKSDENNIGMTGKKAFFDSITNFVDAVWKINLAEETLCYVSDRIVSENEGKVISLQEMRERITKTSKAGKAAETADYYKTEFLVGLRETFSYETIYYKNRREHILSCNMTPGFDTDGNVSEVYVAMKDIQSQIDKDEEQRLYREASDILEGAQMGLWYFVLDEGEPQFFMDDNTTKLVGDSEVLSPEEAYNYWYERVDEEYKSQVLSAVIKMRAGIPAEVIYPYHHPSRGIITVRCGGVLDSNYKGSGQIIRGYHQDITDFNEQLLDQIEISEAIQKHFDAVFELDMNTETLKVLSDRNKSFSAFLSGEQPIAKAFAPIQYAICSHSKRDFADVTNPSCIREKLEKQSAITVEIESITMGWLRMTIIPSSIGKDGNIEKCIQLVENIENIKSRERKAKKELEETLNKERREREILQSMSDIYENAHIFDLAKHTLEEIKSTPDLSEYISAHSAQGVQSVLWGLTQMKICEEHCEDIQKFCRLADLQKRMEGKKILSVEALRSDDQWCRLSFIRVGNVEDKLTRVILVAQNIDAEKRRVENYRVMSHTDELTGLYNRHAYEEYRRRYEIEGLGDNLWYVNVDINGLKATNDSKGHAAGDELIQGVAECLARVFASKGKVFRMGGDEFYATIRCTKEEINEYIDSLLMIRSNWRGVLNEGISFAVGVAGSSEVDNCTIEYLEQTSDQRMYDEKRSYHTVHNRRKDDDQV